MSLAIYDRRERSKTKKRWSRVGRPKILSALEKQQALLSRSAADSTDLSFFGLVSLNGSPN